MPNFIEFPELPNSQMQLYYFQSPHKQILEDFRAKVIRVIDGDTVILRTNFRNFDFPLRMLGIDAPEINEGVEESKRWLENIILNKEVDILMDEKQRVGKWGRLLGVIMSQGMNINEEAIRDFKAIKFEKQNEFELPDINKELDINKWLT